MLVFQTSPVGVELFSYVNTTSFVPICIDGGHVNEKVLFYMSQVIFLPRG